MKILNARWSAPLGFAAALLCLNVDFASARTDAPEKMRTVVDQVVEPLMAVNRIPGMAVAITVGGDAYVLNYGLASKEDGRRVDDRTLFEIGSLSKTVTGTLGAWVAARGNISLEHPVTNHMPPLAHTSFDHIRVIDLGTYTAGGLPLQFPAEIKGDDDTTAFFRAWEPRFPPQTKRLYSNASIGLFGDLAARAEGVPFADLMSKHLLPKLGMRNTYLTVPHEEWSAMPGGYRRMTSPCALHPAHSTPRPTA